MNICNLLNIALATQNKRRKKHLFLSYVSCATKLALSSNRLNIIDIFVFLYCMWLLMYHDIKLSRKKLEEIAKIIVVPPKHLYYI